MPQDFTLIGGVANSLPSTALTVRNNSTALIPLFTQTVASTGSSLPPFLKPLGWVTGIAVGTFVVGKELIERISPAEAAAPPTAEDIAIDQRVAQIPTASAPAPAPAAPAPAAAQAAPAAATGKAVDIAVEQGDTLFSIANKLIADGKLPKAADGVDAKSHTLAQALIIAKVNKIEDFNKIAVGQPLRIPSPEEIKNGMAYLQSDKGILHDKKISYGKEMVGHKTSELLGNLSAPPVPSAGTAAQKDERGK